MKAVLNGVLTLFILYFKIFHTATNVHEWPFFHARREIFAFSMPIVKLRTISSFPAFSRVISLSFIFSYQISRYIHALQGILTIVIMIATGFYLSRKGWFSESFSSAVAQLVTKVCLPTYMIVNLTVNFSHDQLIEMSGGLPVPIISMALGYFIGHAAARLLKVRRDRACSVLSFLFPTLFSSACR